MPLARPDAPDLPGVYWFSDGKGRVIYVGKAKRLKRRLARYFESSKKRRTAKLRRIARAAARVDLEICESELAALIRENELIQKHRPKFNLEGAFSFLYPMIGLSEMDRETAICLTSLPERWSGFRFFGAFRSRQFAREGFEAITAILRGIAHPVPTRAVFGRAWRKGIPRYSRLEGFRGLPEIALGEFLAGTDEGFLARASELLLENAAARARAAEMEEKLREARNFLDREILPLRRAVTQLGADYPVRQADRDALFIRMRHGAPGIPCR